MKPVRFTLRALDGLAEARELGFEIDENTALGVVANPELVLPGNYGRSIAHGTIGERHILRVIYEEDGEIVIVTLYPTRKGRYEV